MATSLICRSPIRSVLQLCCRSLKVFNREIPTNIPLPPYIQNIKTPTPSAPVVHSPESIAQLTHAGSIVRQLFEELQSFIRPGLTTHDIDDFIFAACIAKSVYPSPLGYCGFPKSVCTSVNEVACHGIPSEKQVLRDGDLLSVDISVFTGSAHGDACRTYVLTGERMEVVSADPKTYDVNENPAFFICAVAKACCDAGVAICSPGRPYEEIAMAVSALAAKYGCRVISGIHGHGISNFLHGPPDIVHSIEELQSAGNPSYKSMRTGEVFTIEPCIALPADTEKLSTPSNCMNAAYPQILDDGWTVVTTDRVLTAQFEHTVLITAAGHSILT